MKNGVSKMAKLSKKFCEEWAFYIKPGTRKRIVFNEKCKKCMHECKQSYRVEIIACKNFQKKEGK